MQLTVTRGANAEYKDAAGNEYYSVSQHLQVLDPDAFAGVNPAVLAAAGMRGEKLHIYFGCMLLSCKGLAPWPERPTGILGEYFDSMARWIDREKPVPVLVETSSIFAKLKTAGTPDCLVLIDGVLWLIDLKSGMARPVHSVQLHIYKRLDGYTGAQRLASLYAQRGKMARLVEHTHDHVDYSAFLAANAVLNWRRLRNI